MLLLAGGSKAFGGGGGVKGERSKDDLSMTLPIIPKSKRVMAAIQPSRSRCHHSVSLRSDFEPLLSPAPT